VGIFEKINNKNFNNIEKKLNEIKNKIIECNLYYNKQKIQFLDATGNGFIDFCNSNYIPTNENLLELCNKNNNTNINTNTNIDNITNEYNCKNFFDGTKYIIFMKRSEGKEKIFNKSFEINADIYLKENPSGYIISFFYGGSSPTYDDNEASGFVFFIKNNSFSFILKTNIGTIQFNKPFAIEKLYKFKLIQKDDIKIYFNNNLIEKISGKFVWNDFNNGDWIIGGSDYQDGSGHKYSNFAKNLCIDNVSYKIL